MKIYVRFLHEMVGNKNISYFLDKQNYILYIHGGSITYMHIYILLYNTFIILGIINLII